MTTKSKKPMTPGPLQSGTILHRLVGELAIAVAQRLKGKESTTTTDEKIDASRASPSRRDQQNISKGCTD